MTTIKLNRYYPHLTENITLEVSDESGTPLWSTGVNCAAPLDWTPTAEKTGISSGTERRNTYCRVFEYLTDKKWD